MAPHAISGLGATTAAFGAQERGYSRSSANKFAPRHVLIVDDERLLRWALRETLFASGYRTSEAGDGRAALQALTDSDATPDVVRLDLRLPDCHDLQVLSTMRRLAPRTPIILMTGSVSVEVLEQVMQLGATAVVQKPFDMAAVAPLIEQVLAQG